MFRIIGIKSSNMLITRVKRSIRRLRNVPRIACQKNRAQGREIFLPDEILIDILKRLPVQSLGRCRCVCKLWSTLIQDPKFISEHLRQSKWINVFEDETNINAGEEIFKCRHAKYGVLVEKSNLTGKFRLWNPATNHTLDLPDPHRKVMYIWLFYLPNTNSIKLVDIYSEGREEHGGCQVLTLGIDRAWRAIDCPGLFNLGVKGKPFISIDIDQVLYVTRFLGASEVVRIDIENEHFSHVNIPQALFSSWEHVKLLPWEKKFALGNLVEQELHIWVLEDIKKQKWAERKVVIPLTLFGKYAKTLNTLMPCSFGSEWFWFRRCDDSNVAFNIRTKQEHVNSLPPPGKTFLYRFIPSLLISSEGNHPRKQLEKQNVPSVKSCGGSQEEELKVKKTKISAWMCFL